MTEFLKRSFGSEFEASINLKRLIEFGEEQKVAILLDNEGVEVFLDKINVLREKPPRDSIPAEFAREGLTDLLTASAFYSTLIKPWLATGRDSFKPQLDDIKSFCQGMLSDKGITIVFYYAFSKTRSPNRTGSPDWIIDFGELEMLKYWSLVLGTAKELGLGMKIVMVDETTALPVDDGILGLKESDLQTNKSLFDEYIKLNGRPPIIYRSLIDSISEPLGQDYYRLYNEKMKQAFVNLSNQLQQGQISAEIIRIATFLDCLPVDTLEKYGIDNSKLDDILTSLKSGDLQPILSINQELLSYLINLTSHFKAVMALRELAREKMVSYQLSAYPEYEIDRVYGGVTRSEKRWSFLPHPIRFNGATVNPMHGLAVYNKNGEFLGVCPRRSLPLEGQIFSINNKPFLVKI